MTSNFSLATALCLSEEDTIALISGRSIAALSRMFINSGQNFAICSTGNSPKVEAWAKLISSRMYTDSDQAEALSWNTIWSREYLHDRIQDRKRIFLNILKVYHLEKGLTIDGNIAGDKVGGFVKLPQSLISSSSNSVLNTATFLTRKQRLENLEKPQYPELENLDKEIKSLASDQIDSEKLIADIHYFLGWRTMSNTSNTPDWMSQIPLLCHRENEVDVKKSNYQAGTDFEIIIRECFTSLGFQVSEAHSGGAGGIDAYCNAPYSLAIECKSGKSIPDNTVEELSRIAKRHLRSQYDLAVKLIIGPGKPTKNLSDSAKISKIAIMNPETLQKIVEFNNSYPINLFELREKFLIGGQIDDVIDDFLKDMKLQIVLRSHVVSIFKQYLDKNKREEMSMERFCGFLDNSNSPCHLSDRELHDIMIELSSPFAGYLGRIKGDTWNTDQFYFLRDLTV